MSPSDAFDPAAFMNQQTTEAGSTTFEPIPSGEYTALIDDVNPRTVTGRDGNARVVVDVTFVLQNPEVEARLGRKLSVRSGIFVDLTAQNALDMSKGKNIGLNKLRDALGLNKPGQPFNFNMLKGAGPLKVQVTLRPDSKSDAIFNDIKSYGKM